jgi:hypothetical protein
MMDELIKVKVNVSYIKKEKNDEQKTTEEVKTDAIRTNR